MAHFKLTKKEEKRIKEKRRIISKIRCILAESGWYLKELRGHLTIFTKVSRKLFVIENGQEFTLELNQPYRTCWAMVKNKIWVENGVKIESISYSGRLRNKKDLKRIEKLLNIK